MWGNQSKTDPFGKTFYPVNANALFYSMPSVPIRSRYNEMSESCLWATKGTWKGLALDWWNGLWYKLKVKNVHSMVNIITGVNERLILSYTCHIDAACMPLSIRYIMYNEERKRAVYHINVNAIPLAKAQWDKRSELNNHKASGFLPEVFSCGKRHHDLGVFFVMVHDGRDLRNKKTQSLFHTFKIRPTQGKQ